MKADLERSKLTELARAVSRVSRLIDDMLDITRIRMGKLTMAREELDLCTLIKEVLKQLRSQFEVSPSGFATGKESRFW